MVFGLIGVADFNNDGYPDIVTFCGNPRDDQGTPVIFQNNKGTGEFVKLEDTVLQHSAAVRSLSATSTATVL